MVKILIIDDEIDILDTISALLNAFIEDCEVLTANSGALGIKMAKEYIPDTILLDVTMPEMDQVPFHHVRTIHVFKVVLRTAKAEGDRVHR